MAKKQTSSRKNAGREIGVGIIGCGLMGGIHAESYTGAGGCRVVGFTNRSADKARDLAKKFDGARVFDNVGAMLADDSIDAVSICTSQQVHAEQVIAAARAGKHILVEKPLALTKQELDDVEREVKKAGVTLMVAHQLRFHPVVEAVRAAMPKLGRCYHFDIEMCFRISAHDGRCWMDYRSGGFFMELGVHLADLSRHLMGPIANLSANSLRMNPKRVTEDYTHVLLQFRSNAVGTILVSANHRGARQGLLTGRVLGERGRIDFSIYPYQRAMNEATLVIDGGKSIFVPDVKVTKLKWKNRPSPSKVYPGFFDVYEREVKGFLDAIRTGSQPPVTLEDGRSAVEVVLAAYDAQARASDEPNFDGQKPARYRSDESSHPMLAQ
jgi:predicted dehydrogenase